MSTTKPEALRLADEYAEASFDQGLHKRTLDDAPENARSALEAELRRLSQSEREGWRHAGELEQERKRQHAALAHAERYAEQMGRELSKATAEIADLCARLASIAGGVSQLMGAAVDAGWVDLPGTLPEPGTPVLLDIGKKHPIRAMWAAKHTLETLADADWGDYYEATDTYYCPEGWYECNEYEPVHWRVTGTPVAWCALPAPSSDKGVAHGL